MEASERDRERRQLGLRVRELRRLNALTLRELAERSGVSASMINQIETGTTGASVVSLRRIARGLGVPVAAFLLDGQTPPPNGENRQERISIVRRSQRKALHLPESHLVYELLTPDLGWDIEFVWIELDPGHPPVESMAHPGQECALVLQGVLHVIIGDAEHVLETGDSIAFDSSIPHRIENRGTEKVIEISAITPPRF
jgi:transcriptional regulator with XRE-family HTH domain